MYDTPQKGSLWVRYIGSRVVHRAEVFPLPTDKIPEKVKALVARGDVAEVWYVPGLEFSYNASQEYPKQ